MKTLLVSSLLALTLSPAFAGDKTGNGGISYVCRDANGKITYARLLDLWEPISFNPNMDNSRSVEEQFNEAMEAIRKFDKRTADVILQKSQEIDKITILTTKNLPFTNDALPDYEPDKGCAFEQLARLGFTNEFGDSRLRIYKGIYDSSYLSNTDKAALKMHEALYDLIGGNDSRVTRRIVAQLFSAEGMNQSTKMTLIRSVDKISYRPMIFTNGPTLKINVSGKIKLEPTEIFPNLCKGSATYTFTDASKNVIAEGKASGKMGMRHDSIEDFKDQTITLEAGKKYQFEKKTSHYCVSANISIWNTSTNAFIEDDFKYKHNVEVIDLSK